MNALLKNGLTFVGLAIIAVLGYYLFVLNDDSKLASENQATLNEAQIASEQFLRELNEIKSVKLSDELFVDERFRSFVDFTTPVQQQAVGRSNPFAPVE